MFECETEYTEYSKETKKSFFTYQITQNGIMKNRIFMFLTEHKQIFAKGQKIEIKIFIISYDYSLFPILH